MTVQNFFENDETARIIGGPKGGVLVSASDTNELPVVTRYLTVSTTGPVQVTLEDGSIVTVVLASGHLHPLCARQVWSSITNAGTIYALW